MKPLFVVLEKSARRILVFTKVAFVRIEELNLASMMF